MAIASRNPTRLHQHQKQGFGDLQLRVRSLNLLAGVVTPRIVVLRPRPYTLTHVGQAG